MKHEDWKTFKSSHPGITTEIMETCIQDIKDQYLKIPAKVDWKIDIRAQIQHE